MYINNDKMLFFLNENLVVDIRNLDKHEINEIIKRYDDGISIKSFFFHDYNKIGPHTTTLDKVMPYSCGVNLTNLCQLRCNYCSYCSGEISYETAKKENVLAFFDFIINNYIYRRKLKIPCPYPTIYFAGGGEPTYDWNLLVDCVKYIKTCLASKNIKYALGITTNGIMNHGQLDFISENFNTILVSYDGTSDIQNKNRCGIRHDSSSLVVEAALEYLDKKNCNYSIRSTIWPEDYSRMKDMADNIYRRFSHVNSWSLEPVLQLGRAKRNSIFDIENGKNIMSYDFVDHYEQLQKYVNTKYSKSVHTSMIKEEITCYNCATAFGQYPWLNANGNIYLCLDAMERTERIGYISNGSIVHVPFKDRLNVAHIENMENKCEKCIAFPFCGGGCPLKHEVDTNGNRINIASFWDCAQKEKYWRNIFQDLIQNMRAKNYKLIPTENYKGITIYKMVSIEREAL